eukprot:TRINITY_DN4005_c0_g1_i1.p1 TRINITY_DN4005_c0_g1~~TRINITY_DN4005_c0_g1_i1.p1  ORF type:complete len:2496 (+),score=715.32 TRINITY_DN4005_c0_g1_i1:501-7490(+)
MATVQTAVCYIDECVDTCPSCASDTCTRNSQGCNDLNNLADALMDWECACLPPFQGSSVMGAAAACTIDECTGDCTTCAKDICLGVGQDCVDPDDRQEAPSDWRCECPAPAMGQRLTAVAACILDECAETCTSCAGTTCADAGQTCSDPHQVDSVGDWECACVLPNQGAAVAAAAQCTIDECVASCPSCQDRTCVDAMQICADPAPQHSNVLWDWSCTCQPPSTGQLVGRPAPCHIDECEPFVSGCWTCANNTCRNTFQECVDPEPLDSLGDWYCQCVRPANGSAVGAVAVCELDECEVARCHSCEDDLCSNAGQTCTDPDIDPREINDWFCTCVPPAVGRMGVAERARCIIDECFYVCPTCANTTCSAAAAGTDFQNCKDDDTDHLSLNDWRCLCPKPYAGESTASAVAVCTLDECTYRTDTLCQTCAYSTCAGELQSCEDPVQTSESLSDWICHCPPPSSGNATTAAATCYLNECVETCATCARRTCSHAADGEQSCVDLNTLAASQYDWVCLCPPPSVGNATAAAAVCTLEECVMTGCPTCANGTCEAAGQACDDPNPSPLRTLDWTCTCPFPEVGQGAAALADCVLDECTVPQDWLCPSCEGGVCSSWSQVCEDPNPELFSLDDWTCRCQPPTTGYAAGMQAMCEIDECTADCPSCQKRQCELAGQRCLDPDKSARSLTDWTCNCMLPLLGTPAIGRVAECTLDECDVPDCPTCARGTCPAGQVCIDTDKGEFSLNNWACMCVAPAQGMATVQTAVCYIDECVDTCPSCASDTCTRNSQGCNDLNNLADALMDWECACLPPFQGSSVMGAAAACTIDECTGDCTTCAKDICLGVGQDCVDPDDRQEAPSDWRCECPAPAMGQRLTAVAACILDECAETCTSCAGTTCADAGQTCSDPHQVDSVGDWECACVLPNQGAAVAAAAQCTIDECVASCPSCQDRTCVDAMQICADPAPQHSNVLWDWSCTCQPPSTGQLVGRPAPCHIDECEPFVSGCWTCANNTCRNTFQECVDPEPLDSLGDWYCQCVRPANGSAVGAVAVCELDECEVARCHSCEDDLCSNAGQTCTDPDIDPREINDWFCTCVPPAVGRMGVAERARCIIDECFYVCPTCANTTCSAAAAGTDFQNCKDDDTDHLSLNDWRCLCPKPYAGESTASAVAVCTLDECTYRTDTLCQTCAYSTCAGELQSCEDPVQTSESLSDWICHCPPPSSGNATTAAATCYLNECVETCATCARRTCSHAADGEQSCVDLNTLAASQYDWVCLCPPPSVGNATAAAAVCTLEECVMTGCPTCANGTCEAAGQACDDPNPSPLRTLDWTCTCPFPEVGQGAAALADCVLDECATMWCSTCANSTCEFFRPAQACHDTNTSAASLNDWRCECVGHAAGVAGALQPADCFIDECNVTGCDTCARFTCSVENQSCVDVDTSEGSLEDWVCVCPPPSVGNASAVAAYCDLDECRTPCSTCANGTCLNAGQLCEDPDTSYKSLSDWTCVCPAPGIGENRTAAAVCTLDECTEVCDTCEMYRHPLLGYLERRCTEERGIQLRCDDPDINPNSTSDWTCTCMHPENGTAVAAAPRCVLNECTVRGCPTCADGICDTEYQDCQDPDPFAASLLDWTCNCKYPTSGFANTRAAMCVIDECVIDDCLSCARDTCSEFGQACHDPDTSSKSLEDWTCTCPHPFEGAATAQAVTNCKIDECGPYDASLCPTCAGTVCSDKRQDCEDEGWRDEGRLNDWVCKCRTPGSGTERIAPASCTYPVTRMPPTPPPRTKVPKTEIPPTPVPPTWSPPAPTTETFIPRTAAPTMAPPTPAPPTKSPPTPAPTVAAVPPPPPPPPPVEIQPALRLIGISMGCKRGVDDELPFGFSPTGLRLDGSDSVGAVVGNSMLTLTVLMFGGVGFLMLRRAPEKLRRRAAALDCWGLLAVPSAALFALVFLHHGTAYAAFTVLYYPSSFGWAFLAAGTVAQLVAFAVSLAAAIRRRVPSSAVYRYDRDVTKAAHPFAWFFFGPGEWVSTTDAYTVHSYALALRYVRESAPWFACVEHMVIVAAAATAALRAETWVGCGHIKIVQALLYALLLAMYATLNPYHRARDMALLSVVVVLELLSCVVMAMAYYAAAPDGAVFALGVLLLDAAQVGFIVKMAADVVTEACLAGTRRRARLAAAVEGAAAVPELRTEGNSSSERAVSVFEAAGGMNTPMRVYSTTEYGGNSARELADGRSPSPRPPASPGVSPMEVSIGRLGESTLRSPSAAGSFAPGLTTAGSRLSRFDLNTSRRGGPGGAPPVPPLRRSDHSIRQFPAVSRSPRGSPRRVGARPPASASSLAASQIL